MDIAEISKYFCFSAVVDGRGCVRALGPVESNFSGVALCSRATKLANRDERGERRRCSRIKAEDRMAAAMSGIVLKIAMKFRLI